MPTHEQMCTTINLYIESFAQNDAAAIAALFADNATVEDPVGSPLVQGKSAIHAFYQRAMAMGITLSLEGPVRTAADHAAFPFSIHINSPKGQRRIDVIDLFRFDHDGHIIEMRAFWGPQNNHRVAPVTDLVSP